MHGKWRGRETRTLMYGGLGLLLYTPRALDATGTFRLGVAAPHSGVRVALNVNVGVEEMMGDGGEGGGGVVRFEPGTH